MLKTVLALIEKEKGLIIGRTQRKGKHFIRFILGNVGYIAVHNRAGKISVMRSLGMVSKVTGGIARFPSEFYDYFPSEIDRIEYDYWKNEYANTETPAIKISLNRNEVFDIAVKIESGLTEFSFFIDVPEANSRRTAMQWKSFFNEVFVDKVTKPSPPRMDIPVKVERVERVEDKLIHWNGNTYQEYDKWNKEFQSQWKKEFGEKEFGIELLQGRTLKRVIIKEDLGDFVKRGYPQYNESDRVIFEDTEGYLFILHHESDCCETVELNDVVGDVNDLVGYPLLEAELVESDLSDLKQLPPTDPTFERLAVTHKSVVEESIYESATWSYYKFATIKGHVSLRWLGESNGYYSESVHLAILRPHAVEETKETILLN